MRRVLEDYLPLTQTELMAKLRAHYRDRAASCVPKEYLLVAGDAPTLLVAHLDTVHAEPVREICRSEDGNLLMSPQGIGGDDRCGVYALCEIDGRAPKKPWLLFTCDEETGGSGALAFADDWFFRLEKGRPNWKFLVEIDRKGRGEAVFYDCRNAAFEAYVTGKGFRKQYGSFSDISILGPGLGVAAVNVSAGYYNAHTQHEYINRAHLEETIEKVLEMVADAAGENAPYYEYEEDCAEDGVLTLMTNTSSGGRDQNLETRIAAWLREQWGVEEEGGCFYTELFADYRDEMDKSELQAIADSDDPREAFWDWLDNAYNEAVDQAWFDLASQCSDDLGIEHETAWEFLTEMVEVRLPEQHFLDQEIRVDILVDTGDANYDFICNNIAPAWGGCDPDEAYAEASIFWLAGQQGYCKDYVIAALKGEETRSAFLESLVREVENEASSINVLTFLCTMTLGQWIEVREIWMQAKHRGALRIEKDAVCGLFDPWSGAGSTLDLELERDVVLPIELAHEITPDVCLYRYGVDEVYGLVGKAWGAEVEYAGEEFQGNTES